MENGKPTHFTVHTKGAGKAPLNVQFSSPLPGEAVKDLDIIDNYDYSHTVKYTPTQQVGSFLPLAFLRRHFPRSAVCVEVPQGALPSLGESLRVLWDSQRSSKAAPSPTSIWDFYQRNTNFLYTKLPGLLSYAVSLLHPSDSQSFINYRKLPPAVSFAGSCT